MNQALIVRSNGVLLSWIFGFLWLFGLGGFLVSMIRSGSLDPLGSATGLGFTLVILAVGVGMLYLVLKQPMTSLKVHNGYASLTRRWLWQQSETSVSRSALQAMHIELLPHQGDQDGRDSYRLLLNLPDGQTVALRRSTNEAILQNLRNDILARV